MTIDEIEDLISKHGSITAQPLMDLVVTVVLEAVKAEREACAKVCERLPAQQEIDVRDQCAAAIRERGKNAN